jgi:hypothetical protein
MKKNKTERQLREYYLQLNVYNNLIKTLLNKDKLNKLEEKTNVNHRSNYELYIKRKITRLEKTLKIMI